MSEKVTTYWGLILGNFPLLALVLTKTPAVIGDLLADFEKPFKFEQKADRGSPAYTTVSLGLLGLKIPLKKLFQR